MADEMFDAEDDVVGAEETQGGQRRVGFLSGVLIQVLKWVGIILGAVIFIVTVVIVTNSFLGQNNTGQTRVIPDSEQYRESIPILDWNEQVGELRGSTDDDVRTTFIVQPALGYNGDNNDLTTELIEREIQLVGIFNDYFGSHSIDELEGKENKDRVEQELMDQINRILRSGVIQDIVFRSYQFLPF